MRRPQRNTSTVVATTTATNVLPRVIAETEALTPGERIDAWLAALNPNTAAAYTSDLTYFARYIETGEVAHTPEQVDRIEAGIGQALMSLCSVRPSIALTVLERYRDAMLAAGKASATTNRRLRAINAALAELQKADMGPGRLAVKPAKHEPRRDTTGPQPVRVLMVLEDYAARIARGEADAVRDYAILVLAAQRGLRRSEIVNLDAGDVDLDARTIRVLRKGKRERVAITVSRDAANALRRWLAIRGDYAKAYEPAAFVGFGVGFGRRGQGERISGSGVYQIVRRAGEIAGGRWRPHGLRHTAITSVLRQTNGNLASAQQFAGHAKPATTEIYIDNKGELEREAVASTEGIEPESLRDLDK